MVEKMSFNPLQQSVFLYYQNWGSLIYLDGLSRWHSEKDSACQCRRQKRLGFNPWVRKIPWRRKWQPTPVFLPGNNVDSGAWQATVHGVTKSQIQVSMHAPHVSDIISSSLSLEYWSYFISSERWTHCVLLSMSIINWIYTHLYTLLHRICSHFHTPNWNIYSDSKFGDFSNCEN